MPRAVVLLPTTTYRAGDFVSAAASLGVDLVVATEEDPPFDPSDRYLKIDCGDPERAAARVVALGDEIPLDGVVAADDSGVVIAAIAGSALGLPSNTVEAAMATRDKLAMRVALAASETPQPVFASIGSDAEQIDDFSGVSYPIVVKPLDRTASQGVLRVDDPGQLASTVRRVRTIVGDDRATLLAEEYLTGDEVAVEGLLRDGRLTVLAVFDKPDTPQGPPFPETILITPSRLPAAEQTECIRVAEMAIDGLGLTQGPVHIELKVDDGKAWVIEVAARSIGGLCSRSLNFGLMGTTLEALVLRNAVGLEKPELVREKTASGVLMIPVPSPGRLVEVRGVDEVRAIPGVRGIDLTVTPGHHVAPTPVSDRYLGFVYARADRPETVETALRLAMSTLEVVVS